MAEIWKPVLGFETYYEISDLGRIRSMAREHGRKGRWSLPSGTYRILKPLNNGNGYLYVTLGLNGGRHRRAIHRLVAEAFLSNYSPDLEVNHKNFVKGDNRVVNLEMVTHQQNELHKVTSSKRRRGVYRYKPLNCWVTRLKYDKKSLHLGYFKSKKDAYQAFYNKFLELRGVAPW